MCLATQRTLNVTEGSSWTGEVYTLKTELKKKKNDDSALLSVCKMWNYQQQMVQTGFKTSCWCPLRWPDIQLWRTLCHSPYHSHDAQLQKCNSHVASTRKKAAAPKMHLSAGRRAQKILPPTLHLLRHLLSFVRSRRFRRKKKITVIQRFTNFDSNTSRSLPNAIVYTEELSSWRDASDCSGDRRTLPARQRGLARRRLRARLPHFIAFKNFTCLDKIRPRNFSNPL